MAGGLSTVNEGTPVPRRRAALAAVVLGVLAVHACVTQGVADRIGDLGADAAMPARMEVAYVRDMALSAPPPAATPAAPPAVAPRPRAVPVPRPARKASAPPPAASAPLPDPVVAAADAPEPVPEPASAPASAVEQVAEAVAAPASAASAPAGFEWPASTRMSYTLTGNYRGEVSGSAQVEWVRVGSRYQVHVDFIVGPSFAPLITQRSTSDGEVTAEGLVPRRYDQDIRFLGQSRPRQTIVFDAGNVVLANGDVRPTLPGLQDTASQFVQLTYVFSTRPETLRIGGSVDIPLALPKKVAVWTYDVVEEETLHTPFGPLAGIHLKPRTTDQKAGTLSVEMWMAPQLRYLPVRIRFEQDAQTYVDLLIAKRPEIAN